MSPTTRSVKPSKPYGLIGGQQLECPPRRCRVVAGVVPRTQPHRPSGQRPTETICSSAMRHENRSRHQLHSGHVHCLCINMQAFLVVVARHSMVVLVETSRARCPSDTPRAPVHPTGCATYRPYRRLSRCCTYTACTFDCTPSRRGGAAWPRCRQGERPHSGRSGSACTGPPGSPRQHVRTEEKPRGVLSRSRLRTSSGRASSPPRGRTVQGVTVRRLCRAWCAQAVNACHFRRRQCIAITRPRNERRC